MNLEKKRLSTKFDSNFEAIPRKVPKSDRQSPFSREFFGCEEKFQIRFNQKDAAKMDEYFVQKISGDRLITGQVMAFRRSSQ